MFCPVFEFVKATNFMYVYAEVLYSEGGVKNLIGAIKR